MDPYGLSKTTNLCSFLVSAYIFMCYVGFTEGNDHGLKKKSILKTHPGSHPRKTTKNWSLFAVYVGNWLYGCFLKWWYPQNTQNLSFLLGKPIVVGYQHFRKSLYALPSYIMLYRDYNLPWNKDPHKEAIRISWLSFQDFVQNVRNHLRLQARPKMKGSFLAAPRVPWIFFTWQRWQVVLAGVLSHPGFDSMMDDSTELVWRNILTIKMLSWKRFCFLDPH